MTTDGSESEEESKGDNNSKQSKRHLKARRTQLKLSEEDVISIRRIGGDKIATPPIYATLGRSRDSCHELRAQEVLIPDTGATVSVIPLKIAKRNRLHIRPIEGKHSGLVSSSGHQMEIIGHTRMYALLPWNKIRLLEAVVVDIKGEAGEELLIDWRTLQKWGIISKTFPIPIPEDALAVRSVKNKNTIKGKYEKQLKRVKEIAEREFADVFKSKLDAGDRIRADPIVIKIDEEKLKANPPKTATVHILEKLLTMSWRTC